MKKISKSVILVMLTLALSVGFMGCEKAEDGNVDSGNAETQTDESKAPSGKKEVVKIICPYGVGGTADAIARKFGKVAGGLYPEYEFVVEQKTGGDGFVGAAYFANIKPESKELFVLGYGNAYRHEMGKQFGTEQVPYDLAEMNPLITIDDRTWILYVNPGTTLEEIIVKAKEGSLKMSGGNPLSDPHLALGSLLALEDGDVTVVGYDGGAAQKQGLVSGEVDVFIGTTQAGMEEVEAGILEPILAFSEETYTGLKGTDGKAIEVPGLVNNRHEALDANKDYSGSILMAGGFLAGRTGAPTEWNEKVIEIGNAVWEQPEYSDWMEEIGLNVLIVEGDDAKQLLDDAIDKAVKAYQLLSGK